MENADWGQINKREAECGEGEAESRACMLDVTRRSLQAASAAAV